jgi:diaminohydroxyphosphoribosylaminopyrimidine deaminase/5-amino-6-(5-phosphoribosylamino)uracil reductase
MTNEELILKTLELAKRGLGTTWPNPMVGAVIVKDGKIIGEGYHQKKGSPHAEVNAIENAKQSESVRGSTLFVNLEPCCHTNKTTPPCAQRLIEEGIKKIVICNLDPNPLVNGKGIELLKSHGVEVHWGILEEEGEKLNEVFFLNQRLKRPFIHFKAAVSLDGKIALKNGESQWITGPEAREHVQELRSLHQGILVGGETVRKDNPRLTIRLKDFHGTQPWRIVLTKTGVLPSQGQLFNDEFKSQTLIYTEKNLDFPFPSSQVKTITSLDEVLSDLFERGLCNILLESGPGLSSTFMREGLIDRISLYQNPSILGEGQDMFRNLEYKSLTQRIKLTGLETKWIGGDHYITGRPTCSLV